MARGFAAIPAHVNIGLGTEMLPGLYFDSIALFISIGMLVLLLQITILVERTVWKTLHQSHLTFMGLLVIALLCGYFRFIRTIDFLWPTLILFAAMLVSLSPTAPREAVRRFLPRFVPPQAPLIVLVVLSALLMTTVLGSTLARDAKKSLTLYAALETIPAGAQVLNIDWDLFPPFTYLRPDVRYATGIDPTFTFLTNPKLAQLTSLVWTESFRMEHPVVDATEWVRQLKASIPAEYLVIEARRHKAIIPLLETSDALTLIANTGALAVFALR
jgi:hypothetical protein